LKISISETLCTDVAKYPVEFLMLVQTITIRSKKNPASRTNLKARAETPPRSATSTWPDN
jgi:hypothetical protein